jgi:predicted lipoprotein with Yx(FWY)xxD motif
MKSFYRAACGPAGVLLGLAIGCSKHEANVDTGSSAGAIAPAVAVTAEVAPGVIMTVAGPAGTGLVLVDNNGRSMYILDAVPTDTDTWKPVNKTMTSTDPNVNSSLIGSTKANGTTQATYNGKPLYYYSGDTAAGDKNGQGKSASGATGHLVTPQGNAAAGKGTKKS